MSNEQDEPYNGAAYGYSPFDMLDWECHNWGERECEDYDCCDDTEDYDCCDDTEDYDCCDDAEDYGE